MKWVTRVVAAAFVAGTTLALGPRLGYAMSFYLKVGMVSGTLEPALGIKILGDAVVCAFMIGSMVAIRRLTAEYWRRWDAMTEDERDEERRREAW